MKPLYVEDSIEIDAPPARVWQVLTRPDLTSQWAGAFGAAGPIESTWTLGGEVLWRNAQGEVYVRGVVTALVPNQLLQFTVRDVRTEMQPMPGAAGDITQSYALSSQRGRVLLSSSHGDFATLADGERLFPLVVEHWQRLLPELKRLAESP